MIIRGWIFDAYPMAKGMSLWVIDEKGRLHALRDPWQPRFFVSAGPSFPASIRRYPIPTACTLVERKDFFSQKAVPVWEVRVDNPLKYPSLVSQLSQNKDIELFNADIKLTQAYHYERGHFPLAHGTFECDEEQALKRFTLGDSPWAIDYPLPPLRYAYLSLDEGLTDPNHGSTSRLVLTLGEEREKGTRYAFDCDKTELLEHLNRHINAWDPDVILSDWGDSYIFPLLVLLSRKSKIPLKLSRDPDRGIGGNASRSFYTYGRVVYQGGVQRLFGRWHVDMKNSFTAGHTGLWGLYHVSRLSCQDVQSAARSTIGTKLSAIQLKQAEEDGYLIPLHKQQTEDFRDGMELVTADKGGLVFEPEIGWHENVGEGDFASQYPRIMDYFNVSPETVNCHCCAPSPSPLPGERVPARAGEGQRVPEIGHNICTKRRGLVSTVVHRLLEMRAVYKRLSKTDPHPDPHARAIYAAKAEAIKWIMVTCFGYLGFKNARFGKIEAHECVSAYGRELVLLAKEIAEREGYHVLHANVDSLWLKKEGATEADYKAVFAQIAKETNFPMSFEGLFKWIRFCPASSRKPQAYGLGLEARNGVPNRYFGGYKTGELKVRGIELRRHDTPPIFKAFQEELLAHLKKADSVAACRAAMPELIDIFSTYRARIQSCAVPAVELAFTSQLSKDPSKYVKDTYSSIAARQLMAAGVVLHPGEAIQYVIASAKDKVKDWRIIPLAMAGNYFEYDVKKYLELLGRMFETVTEGLIEQKALKESAKAKQLELAL